MREGEKEGERGEMRRRGRSERGEKRERGERGERGRGRACLILQSKSATHSQSLSPGATSPIFHMICCFSATQLPLGLESVFLTPPLTGTHTLICVSGGLLAAGGIFAAIYE